GDNKAATILIEGCTFRSSGSFAVENVCLLKPTGPKTRTNQLSPYGISTDSSGMPVLRAIDESQGRPWHSSAFLIIQNSSFDRCMHAVNSASDQAVVRDCQVRARADMRGGVFRAARMFKLSRVEGTINASAGRGQHWVTAVDGNLVIRESSLLSRSKFGMSAVYNLATGKYVANSIVIDTCSVNAKGSDKECLVYCQEMPNLVSVRNCEEMSRQETPILGFSRPFNQAYFDNRKHFKFKSATHRFALDLEEHNTALSSRLPKALARYARKPLPEETSALFDAPPPPINARALSVKHWTGIVDGSKFGLFGDGTTDDTVQLAKAIKAAVAQEATLLLPAGIYLTKHTIRLPGPVSIRGVGRAVVKMQGQGGAILQGDCEYILLRDLVFCGGTTAVDLRLSPTYRHRLMFERCTFQDTAGPGIRVLAGRGRAAEPNRAVCRISNSSFANCDQVLYSNVANAWVDNCRVTTSRDMCRKAAIENLGTLVMENVLGVPRVQKTRLRHDQRWIDNHHRVTCRNIRFGNEGDGFCIVLNRHDPTGKARILIENSWTWCTGNERRKAVVWCEELPSWIALRSNVAAPTEQYAIWLGEGVPDKLHTMFHYSSNVFPLKLNSSQKPIP
ncbi:MAG: hypothetical protein KAI66_08315, partial [Lentisphaeria bacterium]|nr:hypothetical protein [Lentisphaeria bacterium]